MNTLESYLMTSPIGVNEETARFTVTDISDFFILSGVASAGSKYTFSFWVRSDAAGSLTLCGSTISSTTSWVKHKITFTASTTDISIAFKATGIYYIYHPLLEAGSYASDWTPAPEDAQTTADEANELAKTATERVNVAQSYIEQLAHAISMLITDEHGASLMTQTTDGWTFNISQITKTLDSATGDIDTLTKSLGGVDSTVKALTKSVNDLGILTDYVIITSYNGQPCIELGEAENDFKLRITNTQIQFVEGSAIPAYISNQKLMIEKAEVKDELQFGGFVWKIRGNGNMGLIWKGVS